MEDKKKKVIEELVEEGEHYLVLKVNYNDPAKDCYVAYTKIKGKPDLENPKYFYDIDLLRLWRHFLKEPPKTQ